MLWPSIPVLAIYPREMQTYVFENTVAHLFIAALVIVAKKKPQMFINR